jgi:hypothetical protein
MNISQQVLVANIPVSLRFNNLLSMLLFEQGKLLVLASAINCICNYHWVAEGWADGVACSI